MDPFNCLTEILIISAASMDAFAASLSYGISKIKIPAKSKAAISIVCTLFLTLAFIVSYFARGFISYRVTAAASFLILFFIGSEKLFDFFLKSKIRKSKALSANITFRIMDLRFLLMVYCDNTKADADGSNTLSIKEAALLGCALSLDGFAAGIGIGLTNVNYPLLICFSLAVNLAAVFTGELIGKHSAKKAGHDMSWISGAVLITLAILKLII